MLTEKATAADADDDDAAHVSLVLKLDLIRPLETFRRLLLGMHKLPR